LTRRDPAVEVILGELLALLATDDKLSVFDADLELIDPKPATARVMRNASPFPNSSML
jgi:hypothetical protein